MDRGWLEERLKQAARKNQVPKVVAPVHFAGNPVDMAFLDKLRKRYGFKVVEDAAHAAGAQFQGERIGSCKWSDLCVFSFHAVKIITTGEGGMVTTNSHVLYEKLMRLRTHGVSRDPRHRSHSHKKPWYYEKLELGNHYRMTDIQAALGRSQLKKIKAFHNARERIAAAYTNRLSQLPLELPQLTPGACSSWHLYPVCVHSGEAIRNRVLDRLRRRGILANLHYLSISQLQLYQRHLRKPFLPCPLAEKLAQREISLPIYPIMRENAAYKVIRELRKAL